MQIFSPDSLPDLTHSEVVVVDRNALRPSTSDFLLNSLRPWLEAGGRLIVFPQSPGVQVFSNSFDRASASGIGDTFLIDQPDRPVFSVPNRITGPDWDGWKYARSWNGLMIERQDEGRVTVLARNSVAPLLADLQISRGILTLVALNLDQQLDDLHEGCFKLLANLLTRAGT